MHTLPMTAAHAAFAPVPAACACGATDINGCFCGTTQADWAAAERTATKEPAVTFTDSIGATIEIGDRVVVNAWGSPVRLIDVGQRGTVVGFARTRVVVDWDAASDAPVRNVPFGNLGVLRRNGAPGFEGNVRRS